jgi:hypothetical protein
MARKAKARTPRRGKRAAVRRAPPKKTTHRTAARKRSKAADPLDVFVVAAAKTLGLPLEKSWLPAIKANLRVTLQHADAVVAFELPDDAQPAPVFKA